MKVYPSFRLAGLILSAVVIVALLAGAGASTVLANHGNFVEWSVPVPGFPNCTPGQVPILYVDWSENAGTTIAYSHTLTNQRTGASTPVNFGSWLSTGTDSSGLSFPTSALIPAGTLAGDTLILDWVMSANSVQVSSGKIAWNCTTGNEIPLGDGCTADGRVNRNCAAPEIVFCSDGLAKFYTIDPLTGEGYLDFTISLDDLQQSVAEKKLIKQDGTVKVYLLPDGRTLLIARQSDGKDYFMYWDPATCSSLQEGAEWGVK